MSVDATHRELWGKAPYHLVKSLVLPLIASLEDFLPCLCLSFLIPYVKRSLRALGERIENSKLWFRKLKLATGGNEQMMPQEEIAAFTAEVENSCYFP